MEPQVKPSILLFSSPAWPAQFGGVSFFICTVGVFFFFPNVPVFVPGISFVFMLIVILFASDVLVVADNSIQTLTINKKRIIASSNTVYPYKDIAFLCQVIKTTINQNGKELKSSSYAIGLNSQTTTIEPNYRGRRLIPITIPGSSFSAVNTFVGDTIKITRARLLADFIGVPFYIQGGEYDTAANIQEDIPQYVDTAKKISEMATRAKDASSQM